VTEDFEFRISYGKENGQTQQKGDFFPEVKERLNMKINLTQNFTAMVTGHGKTNSYLHRFKIIKTPTCPCGNSDQNTDQLLFDCQLLNKERNLLKQSIQKTNSWPTNKRELIGKHIKDFMKFTNEITLDEINVEHNSRKGNC
jgi:hypothetical protein